MSDNVCAALIMGGYVGIVAMFFLFLVYLDRGGPGAT